MQICGHFTSRLPDCTAVNEEMLRNIVVKLNPSRPTCSLDPIPTSLSKSVFYCLEVEVPEMINFSLLTCFSHNTENCCCNPCIKKNNHVLLKLNNCTPIWNISFLNKMFEDGLVPANWVPKWHISDISVWLLPPS